MPLERDGEACDPENLVGVRFAMRDQDKNQRVICLVTFEALQDRAAFDGNGTDWLRAWREHRATIEQLASAHYDNGTVREDGWVVVNTADLTPLKSLVTRVSG